MRKALLVLFAMVSILLLPQPSHAAICIWVGGGGDALWSNPGNWIANDVPNSGDVVVIPVNVATGVGTNNLNNLVLAGLVFQHSYFLSGNEITLSTNGLHVDSLPANVAVSINTPLRLNQPQTWTVEHQATFINGNVTLTNQQLTLEVNGTGELRISGDIVGSGALRKTGVGILRLAGDNTYTGKTFVNEGYLVAMHANALGVAD